MKLGPKDYLKLGDHNAICDVCGFKFKASELKKRWDGFMVCTVDFEVRHPQDLIRAVKDDASVPWSRPPSDIAVDVPGWAETVVDGTPQAVTFGPVDPDSL